MCVCKQAKIMKKQNNKTHEQTDKQTRYNKVLGKSTTLMEVQKRVVGHRMLMMMT